MWQHVRENKVLRQIRKETRREHEEERVRHRDWAAAYDGDPDAFVQIERVMPRTEGERRRANMAAVQNNLLGQAGPAIRHSTAIPTGPSGVVIAISTGLCQVRLADGDSLLCEVRRSLAAEMPGFTNAVAVGDEVTVTRNGGERGMVTGVSRGGAHSPGPIPSTRTCNRCWSRT